MVTTAAPSIMQSLTISRPPPARYGKPCVDDPMAGKHTLCFAFAAVLIILAWRIASIELPNKGIYIHFNQVQEGNAPPARPKIKR